jgi:hypothetical protein
MLRGFMQNNAGPKNMCKKTRKTRAGQISRGVIQGLAWCPGESPVSPLPLSLTWGSQQIVGRFCRCVPKNKKCSCRSLLQAVHQPVLAKKQSAVGFYGRQYTSTLVLTVTLRAFFLVCSWSDDVAQTQILGF